MHQHELRDWRQRNGYTQETAANLLNYTIGHYRKMEYGLCPISKRAEAWVKILDVNKPKAEEAIFKNVRYDY